MRTTGANLSHGRRSEQDGKQVKAFKKLAEWQAAGASNEAPAVILCSEIYNKGESVS